MEKLKMPLQMNDKIVTTNELVRTVICSVLEDLENNFDSYAALYTKDFEEYTPDEKEKIEQWKCKIFNKLNRVLKKQGLKDND